MALDGDGPTLSPIQVPRASDVLATTLRDGILSGQFPEGKALPTERELITVTQTSRTTVREALRILESQGFVEMRTGRSGGPFAKRPGSDAVAQSVGFAIRGEQTSDVDLHETREAIEPAIASLAARYRTDEDLERIDAATREFEAAIASGSHEGIVLAKMAWHVAVSQASHNTLLIGFMKALGISIQEITLAGDLTEGMLVDDRDEHARILDAIVAKDAAAAEAQMRAHVGATRRLIRTGPQTRA